MLLEVEWESENFKLIKHKFDGKERSEWLFYFIYSQIGQTYRLLIDKRNDLIVMSDTEYEWVYTKQFIDDAQGSVLITGLGMNFIPPYISLKTKDITIIEKEQEIIDNVETDFKVVKGDIFYDLKKLFKEDQFDTIIVDIWGKKPIFSIMDEFNYILKPNGKLSVWKGRDPKPGGVKL